MSKIILNTTAIYAEIPGDYDVLNINLVAVKNSDANFVSNAKISSLVKDSIRSYYESDELSFAPRWDSYGEEEFRNTSDEDNFKLLYEVEVVWERWGSSSSNRSVGSEGRAGRLRTHAMPLEEAKLEKQVLTKQIMDRHQIVDAFRDFLGDPDTIAVGMLSSKDWEREAAKIVDTWLKDREKNLNQA